MSNGRPTKLVRDGGTESYDPPPDLPLPDVLVRADSGSGVGSSGEAGEESGYSEKRAAQAALDAISGGAIVDEPGGNW